MPVNTQSHGLGQSAEKEMVDIHFNDGGSINRTVLDLLLNNDIRGAENYIEEQYDNEGIKRRRLAEALMMNGQYIINK